MTMAVKKLNFYEGKIMKRFHGIVFVGGILLTFAVHDTAYAMQAQEPDTDKTQVNKQVNKDDELSDQECSQYCKGCEDCIELNYSKCCKKDCCKKLICPKKKKPSNVRVANLTDEALAENTKDVVPAENTNVSGVKDTMVKLLKQNALVRGIRNITEIAYLPTMTQTLWTCKDIALCFCPGSNLIYCCVAGGFVVLTLADIGWSLKDVYDNTVTVEDADDEQEDEQEVKDLDNEREC